MSLDKAIEHGKEHRKPYRGAKAVDPMCRNHGGDNWDVENRMIQTLKEKAKAESKIKESLDEDTGL